MNVDMDEKTHKALLESIEHWRKLSRVRKFENVKIGTKDCALCSLYNTYFMAIYKACEGCPVYQKSGKQFCGNTPYRHANEARDFWGHARFFISWRDHKAEAKQFRAAAKGMLEFLLSLVPDKSEGK